MFSNSFLKRDQITKNNSNLFFIKIINSKNQTEIIRSENYQQLQKQLSFFQQSTYRRLLIIYEHQPQFSMEKERRFEAQEKLQKNCIFFIYIRNQQMFLIYQFISKSKFNLIIKMGDRIRKQCRYSALSTLTMRMIKQIDIQLYHSEKKITEKQKIKRQKNYYIVLLRICRAYSYLLKNFKQTRSSVVNHIYEHLGNRLDRQIQSKYKDHELIEQTKKKNHRDLNILMETFMCDLNDFRTIQNHLSQLYQIKSVRQHQKQLKILTNIFITFSNTASNNDYQVEKNLQKSNQEKQNEKNEYQIPDQMFQKQVDEKNALNEYKDNLNTRNISEYDDFYFSFTENFIREKSGPIQFPQFDNQLSSDYKLYQ